MHWTLKILNVLALIIIVGSFAGGIQVISEFYQTEISVGGVTYNETNDMALIGGLAAMLHGAVIGFFLIAVSRHMDIVQSGIVKNDGEAIKDDE